MATDAVTLSIQGNLYANNPPPQWQLMKLALLQQILLAFNPMAAVDPTSLLNVGSAYCPYDPGTRQLMELALLAQLVTVISGGAPNGMQCGNFTGGTPNFTPATGCGMATDTSNGHVWIYLNGAWRDTGITIAH